MTTSKGREVNPEAVRYYREKLGMTQEDLAEKSKLGRKTIQRYESKGDRQTPNATSLNKLTEALQVRQEDLMKPPSTEDIKRLLNRVELKTDIAGPARTALTVMQLHYGLLEEAILDLAPLAFLILAEKSLQERNAALNETKQEIEAVTENVHQRHPYMRDTYFSDKDWIATERKSLDDREVYEQYIDDEQREMSPFVDFLEKELKALGLFQKHPIEFFSDYKTAPDYAIPVEIIAPIVGLDINDEAHQRALDASSWSRFA
jgi:transcriptional regulator with XRE-family HTH domain